MSGVACLQNTKFYHNMLTWKCESSTGNIVPRLYLAKKYKKAKKLLQKGSENNDAIYQHFSGIQDMLS